jgi:hypothetical protein
MKLRSAACRCISTVSLSGSAASKNGIIKLKPASIGFYPQSSGDVSRTTPLFSMLTVPTVCSFFSYLVGQVFSHLAFAE